MERVAIVYAFTYEPRRENITSRKTDMMSVDEFANLGINGLKRDAVYRHRHNWQAAIDEGWAVAVAPGDAVAVTTLPQGAMVEGDGGAWRHGHTGHTAETVHGGEGGKCSLPSRDYARLSARARENAASWTKNAPDAYRFPRETGRLLVLCRGRDTM